MSSVAIVMSTYNGERYVGEQIESIMSSTYQGFKLFINDDGSKDNTIAVLSEYEKIYPNRIHVRQNKVNLGVTQNFLHSISETVADYVMLCDQDDVWLPEKIDKTLKRMKSMEHKYDKSTPIAVFTDAVIVDSKLNTLKNSFFQSSNLDPSKIDLSHLLMENKLIGCTVMVNRALRDKLNAVALPQKARLHDGWLALIAASFGRISFINEGTLLYRQHGNNVIGNIKFSSYIKNRITNLGKQRQALLASMHQADEFSKLYQGMLPRETYLLIKRFADLHQENYVKRKYLILRHGYLKTGILRNIGLILLV